MSEEKPTKEKKFEPGEEKGLAILMCYDKLIKILINFENGIGVAKKLLDVIEKEEKNPDVKAFLDNVPGHTGTVQINKSIREAFTKIYEAEKLVSTVLDLNEALAMQVEAEMKAKGQIPENKPKGDPNPNLN